MLKHKRKQLADEEKETFIAPCINQNHGNGIDVYLVERFIMLRGFYGIWHSAILFQKSGNGVHPIQPEISWKYTEDKNAHSMERWKHKASSDIHHDHLRTSFDDQTFAERISDHTKYSNLYMSYGTRGARSKMTLNWQGTGTFKKEKIGQVTAGYDLKTIMKKTDEWIRSVVSQAGDEPDLFKMDRRFLRYHLFKANCYKWCKGLTKMLKDTGMLDQEMGNRFSQYDDRFTFAKRVIVGIIVAMFLAGSLGLLCAVPLAAGLVVAKVKIHRGIRGFAENKDCKTV